MIKLPWKEKTAPNVMLEITDSCNISCRACYKNKGDTHKSISEIENELKNAMRLRKLHTVTISGGEPTLHPELVEIIKTVKKYNLKTFLLTNGLLITEGMLAEFKKAGLDAIYFHLDTGQTRDDIPSPSTVEDIENKLNHLIGITLPFKIDISISHTIYDDNFEELNRRLSYFMGNKNITFIFLSKAVILKGAGICNLTRKDDFLDEVVSNINARFNIDPFCYIPATGERKATWLSWYVPVVFNESGSSEHYRIKPNFIDSVMIYLPKILTGRHVHKTSQNSSVTILRTAANGITTFRLKCLFRFLKSALKKNSTLCHKIIVYDDGPYLDSNNELGYCSVCPTPVYKNGELVRPCEAGYRLKMKEPKDAD